MGAKWGRGVAWRRPGWWDWELELSGHLLERMIERGFSETDLRAMLEGVSRGRVDFTTGRWVVEAKYEGRTWKIVLEPDGHLQRVVVVTAFALG